MSDTAIIRPVAKGNRHRQILDAALAVFSRKGYGQTTIPDIAAEAGVAVGTIYHYYQSKRDLLVTLIHTYARSERLSQVFAHVAREDSDTSVRSILETGLDWQAEDLKGFIFVLTEVLRDPELGEHFSGRFLGSLLESMEEFLGERMSSGEFRRVDQRVTARAIGGMVLGFLLLKQMEGDRSPAKGMPLPDLTAEMADIILEGIEKRDR
jgi:AcrR family transcriptional regulator